MHESSEEKNRVPEESSLGLLIVAALLFPGFLTMRVTEYFVYTAKLEGIELIAAALAATLVDLGLALTLSASVPKKFRSLKAALTFGRGGFVVLISVVAVATGLLWALVDSSNWLFRFRLTERATRAQVWDAAFHLNDVSQDTKYVRVVTTHGDVYHGLPRFYSEGSEERTLLLEHARREVAVVRPEPKKPVVSRRMQFVECIPVGTANNDGSVLILKDQIRIVEFRPADASAEVTIPGKGTARKYTCDETVPVPVVEVPAEKPPKH